MKRYIHISLIAFVFLGATLMPGAAKAQESSTAAMLERIEELTALIADLKERVTQMRSETRETRAEIRENLRKGMQHEDVREIQEILATDPSVYPEGITSGYFGRLTEQAISRFQERFGLTVTGTLTEETRAYLERLIEERRSGDANPSRLLRTPDIKEKVDTRLRAACSDGNAPERLCERLYAAHAAKNDTDTTTQKSSEGSSAGDTREEAAISVRPSEKDTDGSTGTQTDNSVTNVSIRDVDASLADEETSSSDEKRSPRDIDVTVENSDIAVSVTYTDGSTETFRVGSDVFTEGDLVDAIVAEADLDEETVRTLTDFDIEEILDLL